MDRTYRRLFAGAAAVALAVSSVGSVAAQDERRARRVGRRWRQLHDRHDQHRRRQRLARGDALLDPGPGRRVGPGRRARRVAHRNTDAAGQLEDIRNLIAAGVDAIIVNPSDAERPRCGHQGSHRRRHRRRRRSTRRSPRRRPTRSTNDQTEYARLGADWLFEHARRRGRRLLHARLRRRTRRTTTVTPASRPRSRTTPTSTSSRRSSPAGTRTRASSRCSTCSPAASTVDGVWTSGIDNVIVEAYLESGCPLVPIVGADNAGFVTAAGPTVEGLVGRARSPTPAPSAVRASRWRSQILNGEARRSRPTRSPRSCTSTPCSWPTTTEEGKAAIEAAQNPNLARRVARRPPVPGWTTYTKEELIACGGPGE